MADDEISWKIRNDIVGVLKINLQKILAAKTAASLKKGGKNMINMVNAFKENLLDPAERTAIHETLAREMREAVIASYEERVIHSGGYHGQYRKGEGRLSGNLLAALESTPIFSADASGVLIDARPLDATAKHWARLNFGAVGGSGFSGISFQPRSFFVRFGQSQGFSLSFGGHKSPAFRVPEAPAFSGHFNADGQFFIGYPKKDEVTGLFPQKGEGGQPSHAITRGQFAKGIGARHFFDAALESFQQRVKPLYGQFIEDAARRAQEGR